MKTSPENFLILFQLSQARGIWGSGEKKKKEEEGVKKKGMKRKEVNLTDMLFILRQLLYKVKGHTGIPLSIFLHFAQRIREI